MYEDEIQKSLQYTRGKTVTLAFINQCMKNISFTMRKVTDYYSVLFKRSAISVIYCMFVYLCRFTAIFFCHLPFICLAFPVLPYFCRFSEFSHFTNIFKCLPTGRNLTKTLTLNPCISNEHHCLIFANKQLLYDTIKGTHDSRKQIAKCSQDFPSGVSVKLATITMLV